MGGSLELELGERLGGQAQLLGSTRLALYKVHCADGEVRGARVAWAGWEIPELQREMKISERMRGRHPHTMFFYRAITELSGGAFAEVGALEGELLGDRLRGRGAFPMGEVVRIVAPLARLLEDCHREGIVHSTISPLSIFLRSNGAVVLSDFGYEAMDPDLDDRPRVGGSIEPRFFAPEVIMGGPDVGGEADVFSLGVLLYTMLSGAYPFSGKTMMERLSKLLKEELPPLRGARIPKAVASMVEGCLRKKPAERGCTALKVAEVLERGV